ncbi:proton-conducting transporter membrane subunit [Azospirillum halopraeferens]|uniref:proton-conducting transporter transmembrane domain-containing protein n=1 Tax=Azospirillum halopraeferens TaxID=34010 RepID=UPI0004276A0A|nr:proton-conducting transporter membrane subunit [Azospirillum halopraeferens]
MDTVLLPLFAGIAAGVWLYARSIPQGGRSWWPLVAATIALVAVSRLAGHGWGAMLLAFAAELVAAALILSRGTPAAAAAARLFLGAMVAGTAAIATALALTGFGTMQPAAPLDKVAVALLMLGFALKLGLVPVYFWLPAVARASSVMTTAVIVAVVDVAGFCELLALREAMPWVFEGYAAVWIALALASLLGAGLLALAQSELKPMLAFSTIHDMGYLLLGVVLGGPEGMAGAWFAILGHALGKLVMFGAVGAAEWHLGAPPTLDTRGLSSSLPVAGAAFMLGALAFVGIPPTVGFLGHWRLYLAGAELGGPVLLAALFAGSAMGILCYVRAIHRTWLGPAGGTAGGPALPRAAAAVLLAFAITPVVLGLVPGAVGVAAPEAAVHATAPDVPPAAVAASLNTAASVAGGVK